MGIIVALSSLLHPRLGFLFDGAWFSATLVSFTLYAILMLRRTRAAAPDLQPTTLETR